FGADLVREVVRGRAGTQARPARYSHVALEVEADPDDTHGHAFRVAPHGAEDPPDLFDAVPAGDVLGTADDDVVGPFPPGVDPAGGEGVDDGDPGAQRDRAPGFHRGRRAQDVGDRERADPGGVPLPAAAAPTAVLPFGAEPGQVRPLVGAVGDGAQELIL